MAFDAPFRRTQSIALALTLRLACALGQEEPPLLALARAQTRPAVTSHPKEAPAPLLALIDFHQRVLSPADGPRSHFAPVSSTYARQAVNRFGWPGLALVFDRLMRENGELWFYPLVDWGDGPVKFDPVPQSDVRRFAFFHRDAMGRSKPPSNPSCPKRPHRRKSWQRS